MENNIVFFTVSYNYIMFRQITNPMERNVKSPRPMPSKLWVSGTWLFILP